LYDPPSDIIYESALLAFLVLHTYEELLMRSRALWYKCTICRIFGLRYELWKLGVNLIKILPNFINIINSEGNGIVGEKLVRPAIPCRACFSPRPGKDWRPL